MGMEVLSAEDLHHFGAWGFVRVPQALSDTFVARVRAAVWRNLEARTGMVEADRSTWRPEWCGVNKDKIDGFAGTPVTERLAGAIGQILGEGSWRPLRTYGGLLMTMPEPTPEPWEVVRRGWHFDNDPRAYQSGVTELMLFTVYSPVEAQGGGTLVLAGSHHLAQAYVRSLAEGWDKPNDTLDAFGKWCPYLAQLQGLQPREAPESFQVGVLSEVEGTQVFVAELTGEPGDAILCHPALWHATSRNASDRPRIMRRTNVRRMRKPAE